MNRIVDLKALLPALGELRQQLTLFALVNLGLIESLADGLLSATDAVRLFYNADNGLFVRKQLREKKADEIMSRGAQLPTSRVIRVARTCDHRHPVARCWKGSESRGPQPHLGCRCATSPV